MKRLFSVILLSTALVSLKAQDTIVKRDGVKIISKVTEVNAENIRYKKYDNPEGPVYSLNKELLRYVIYVNGLRDTFENYVSPPALRDTKPMDLTIQPSGKYYYYKELRIAEVDMHTVVKRLKDPRLNNLVKSTENMKFIQDVAFIASIPVFITGAYVYEKNQPFRGRRGRFQINSSQQQLGQRRGTIIMVAALVLDAVSISFMLDRRRHNHLLVNEYNKKIVLVQP